MVAYNVWFHVWKTVAPLNLGPIYELPPRVNPLELPYLLSAAGGLAITAAVWLLRRRWPAGLAIWAFYLVMLAPVAGIVHTGNHLGADRNTYVPGMGFALLVGALAVAVVLAGRRGVLRTPIVAMALGVGGDLDRRPRADRAGAVLRLARLGNPLALRHRGRSRLRHLPPQPRHQPRPARGLDPGAGAPGAGDRAAARPIRVPGHLRAAPDPDGPAPGGHGQAPLPPRPGARATSTPASIWGSPSSRMAGPARRSPSSSRRCASSRTPCRP